MLAAMRRGVVLGEQLGRRAASGFVLEIDVSEGLPAGVAHDEAGIRPFNLCHGGGERRAAGTYGVEFGLTSAMWTFPAGAAAVIGERTTPGGSL